MHVAVMRLVRSWFVREGRIIEQSLISLQPSMNFKEEMADVQLLSIQRPRPWSARNFQKMRGYDTPVHQCAYCLTLPGDDDSWYPAKKPTTFRTTKKSLYDGLIRKCPGCPYHIPIEG